MDDVSKASTMQGRNKTIKDGIAQFEPSNWREGMKYPPWKKSMQDEFDSLTANGTWILVLLSTVLAAGQKVISGKWVFKNKLNETGGVLKNKSRWVARGFSQIYGLNYTDTFAPTPTMTAIRILFSHAAQSIDSPAIRDPPYCTGFECGDFWRRGHAHST